MSIFSQPLVWPPLSQELEPFLKYCKGIVLNAGSGQRGIKLGDKDFGIDIVPDNNPDIVADLHSIPLLDEVVDTIVSIAVLEHTRYPWIVAQEFYRILRPGGYGVIAVPFLQPQHACPNDFVRFTENGLIELMNHSGFEVVETTYVHHFGQTLAWLLWEYLQYNKPSKIIKPFWFFLINQLSKGNLLKGDSPNTHNTHYVVVRKPGDISEQNQLCTQLINSNSRAWFFPILACPKTKQRLHQSGENLISEDGNFTYKVENGIPYFV
jgi:SAM-dependent methyltransferase